ncbi:MAG: hypothetical protein GWN84_23100 [Gammaproteobacteria bacterium]|nr:hypothetical protein [Gammaproteobacteria bacterium]NIR85496.1 hypothetical protein [Gammaproteobacteria bacterium]NIR89548.1 hypothetical protein [Gammaproteobacteria bacterium]NIU06633.1 hypothetical protein [Gammaproteobacteria bacterium]NIV53516.1 hypothetical protein [Gammaproteobacteria bacterium]
MSVLAARVNGWTRALGAAGLTAFGGLGTAAAQQPTGNPFLENRFHLAIGGFFPTIDSDIRLEGSEVAKINAEDTLGLDDSTETFWATARWRFARRHAVEFEWVQLDRDAKQTADERFTATF